jgi:hypothetical protein
VKNAYLEQVRLNGIKCSKDTESENVKITGQNNVDCIFKLKLSLIMNLCRKS